MKTSELTKFKEGLKSNPEVKKLIELLEESKSVAKKAAEKGSLSGMDTDPGNLVAAMLVDIWNGFMTGDEEDDSFEDMLFKTN